MKKTNLILISMVFMLVLTCCGRQETGQVADSDPVSSEASAASDASEPETTQTPAPTKAEDASATPVPEEPTAAPVDPDSVFYFSNALERGRIYRQGLDGSDLSLLCDVEASHVTEMGDTICFLSKDALCRCPAEGGSAEIIFDEDPVYDLCKVTDTDLLFWSEAGDYQHIYNYNTVSGETMLLSDRLLFSDVFATAGRAVYPIANPKTGELQYLCFDPESGESVPCPERGTEYRTLFAYGGYVYEYNTELMTWSRYHIETLEREDVDFGGQEYDNVLGFDGTNFLMSNGDDARCIELVTGSDRKEVFRFEPDECDDIWPVAQKGGTAIVSTVKYEEVPVFSGEETWLFERIRYYAFSVGAGTAKEITAVGQAGSMFADGSFPALDVSTARKPLAMGICSLFYRNYGFEGAEPANNKSHGAWLNLADKGCDIILVPAPTEEEKAYLAERNVEVDQKVFGADGLVFICGTGSGVTDLTTEQLKAIYRGEITNWSELGGADHPITVFYRNDQSGSQRQFEKLVWKEEAVPDFGALGFSAMNDMETIVQECQADPYAIGYSIMTYLTDVFNNEDVTLLGIDGVKPTEENVRDNLYSLSLQDCVVIRSDEPEDSPARRLYNWFGTPLSDDVLRQYGLTPVH